MEKIITFEQVLKFLQNELGEEYEVKDLVNIDTKERVGYYILPKSLGCKDCLLKDDIDSDILEVSVITVDNKLLMDNVFYDKCIFVWDFDLADIGDNKLGWYYEAALNGVLCLPKVIEEKYKGCKGTNIFDVIINM